MKTLYFEGFIDDVAFGLNNGQKYCFILGAGASVKSGIPSGEMLVDEWEKKLCKRNPAEHAKWKESQNINADNQTEHYSDYYERYLEYNPERLKIELTACMEKGKPSVGYIALAHILTNSSSSIVITTNFDHLTEDAINQMGAGFPRVVGHEALANFIDLNETRPTIIKLHRDILFEPKSTNEQTKVLERSIQKKLPKILAEYQPIFVGYAGNDRSLMDFLSHPKNLNKFGCEWKTPYWTIYEKKPTSKQHDFLQKANGFLICNCSFDQVMIALGQRFGWKMPTKEAYLAGITKKAEEDYNRLAKQFQPFIQIEKRTNPEEKKLSDVQPEINKSTGQIVSQSVVSITSHLDYDKKEKQYHKAIEEYNKGKYLEARAILHKIIENHDNDPRIYNALSSTYDALKDYENAIKYEKIATKLAPDDPFYHDELAKVYYHKHDRNKGDQERETANRLRTR